MYEWSFAQGGKQSLNVKENKNETNKYYFYT